MNLFISFFICYFFISLYVKVLISSIKNNEPIPNKTNKEDSTNVVENLTDEELKNILNFFKKYKHEHEHEHEHGDGDGDGNEIEDEIEDGDRNRKEHKQKQEEEKEKEKEKEHLPIDETKDIDSVKHSLNENNYSNEDILKDLNQLTSSIKEKKNNEDTSIKTKETSKEEQTETMPHTEVLSEQTEKNVEKLINLLHDLNTEKNDEVYHEKTRSENNSNTITIEKGKTGTDETNEKEKDETIKNTTLLNLENLIEELNLNDNTHNTDDKNSKFHNLIEQLSHFLQNMHNKNNREKKEVNKNIMKQFEKIFSDYLHMHETKKGVFRMDTSVNKETLYDKETILLERYNQNEIEHKKNQHDNHEASDNSGNNGNNANDGTMDRGKIANANNEKLKKYFSLFADNYNPYSYEHKILSDLANDDDIKSKYNITDEFEKNIMEKLETGDIYSIEDEEPKEEETQETEKKKKEEMFEDTNEQDYYDSIEQGSINNRILRRSKTGRDLFVKNVFGSESNSLFECNCSDKVKNCILYFMDLNNLEYILQSLEIDVKGTINKYEEAFGSKENLVKEKKRRKSASFLLPLPPLKKHSHVHDVSSYVLRVPRVLFLTTRKAFTSSFDRYFYHIYNIMENQLKWNTFLWGYGFKYYPLIYPKNLNALLQSHVHQLGKQPFDLIFVHESFISSYYNHYFFMKHMPKLTTLIFITDGWDINVKNNFLNLFPNIMFQNQVNIFEFNPLNSLDIEKEKDKLSNSLWNKVSNADIQNVITNKHKKRKENKLDAEKNSNTKSNLEKTLWAFLPHGVNHCCSIHYDQHFEANENMNENQNEWNDIFQNTQSSSDDNYANPYADDEENEDEKQYNVDNGEEGDKQKNSLINKNRKFEYSYMLLDLFVQECHYKREFHFNDELKDIDVLFLYNATTKKNDFIIQKIMDNIYNKHKSEFKKPIQKYVVDTYFWKLWGFQTTHQLIKNKVLEYNNTLLRSKVCVISSKFIGTLNRMVVDALFNGCVVITDKSHNKNLNSYIVSTQTPFEYYEIPDLIYYKENLETLSKDLINKIKKTLEEIEKGERNESRIAAYKTILTTYTYTGVVLNWIIPSLYFYYNRDKYELTNNYFVLPHYFEKIIPKSLKSSNANREKIIASIDISLQEDIVMNNNEVFVWCIIWFLIFTIILVYILRNTSFLQRIFSRKKKVYYR